MNMKQEKQHSSVSGFVHHVAHWNKDILWTSSNQKKQLVDTGEPFPSKFKEEEALHQAHNKVKYEINLEYFVDEGLLMDPPQIPRHQR